MRDLSLHLLDIAQNSIAANAKTVTIMLSISSDAVLRCVVEDDGKGMSEEMVGQVKSPFVTSRKERKVGLGIPLLTENARITGGEVTIQSAEGIGTKVEALFHLRHVDCIPIGDVCDTLYTLIMMNPAHPDFVLQCETPKEKACFDTRLVREALGGLPLNEPEIAAWIKAALYEEINPVLGGAIHEINGGFGSNS